MKIGAGIVLVLVALLVMARDGRAAEPPQPWPMLALAEVPAVFDSPVHITHAGDGSGRLFIVHKVGLVEILQGNQVLSPPFLDIRDRVGSDDFETGLFSIAFPPDFKASGVFYVDYTTKESVIEPDGTEPLEPDGNHDTIVARFRVTADPNIADPAGEERILIQNQPYRNHNGRQLLFGPDGYLYIGFGDGGGLSDPLYTSQRTNTLLGKLLRVQVGASGPYTVPTTNPFYGKEGYRPEIWAMGLRNPWRFSFDRLTGDLYIGDVGKSSYEEINFQPASSPGGENYGWSITEGMHCYNAEVCDQSGITMPIVEYAHGESGNCSVTGGVVYRGSQYPHWAGVYFYGDFCTGRIWGLRRTAGEWETQLLLDTDLYVTTFGEDEAGNVYVGVRDFSTPEVADRRLFRLMDSQVAATLSFTKTVVGEAPETPWRFSGSSGLGDFTLPGAGGQITFTVAAGVYTVTEQLTGDPAAYTSQVTCTDGASAEGAAVTVTLAAGEHVGCTFTNTRRLPASPVSHFLFLPSIPGQDLPSVAGAGGHEPIQAAPAARPRK